MKQFVCLALFLLMGTDILAQTKLIAHKSLSGTNGNFSEVYARESTVLDGSNFGRAPRSRDKLRFKHAQPQLDTVIFLSRTHAVMVTSCEAFKRGAIEYTPSPFWKPGHDTVLNHPLFSKKHSLDSIKDILKSEYSFVNDIETTVFLGYDNDKQQVKGWRKGKRKNKKNAIPFVPALDEKTPPFVGSAALLLVTLSMLSILGGILLNRFSRRAM